MSSSSCKAPVYELYQLNDETGEYRLLGKKTSNPEWREAEGKMWGVFRMDDPRYWPSVEGDYLCIDLVGKTGTDSVLYNIPIQMGEDVSYLQMNYSIEDASENEDTSGEGSLGVSSKILMNNGSTPYEVYGIWEGYDEKTQMPGRNTQSLSQIAGRNYQFLYPVYREEPGETRYEASGSHTMFRNLFVEDMLLTTGTYYIRYIMTDIFGRDLVLPLVEMNWDGNEFTVIDNPVFEKFEW